jgi:hypothetical protein
MSLLVVLLIPTFAQRALKREADHQPVLRPVMKAETKAA